MTDMPSDTPKQPKRPPPTIDLEATRPGARAQWWQVMGVWPSHSLLAALGGAFAALAIVALLWIAGLLPQRSTPIATTGPAVEDIMAQLARTEAKIAALPNVAVDPALAARLTSVEQAIQASQSAQQSGAQALQTLRRQLEAMMASLDEIKSTPRAAAPAVDFAPLNQRIGELEQSIRALAQDTAQRKEPVALDAPVARMLVAQQLDVAVRAGTPFVAQLNAAKASGGTTTLAALEPFAANGLPDDATLSRELVALLPQLEPKPVAQPSPSGLVERFEASAARLVRIKPVGDNASDAGGVLSRVAAAARRNDVAAARLELDRLEASQRAPAEAWIKRVDARTAARKAAADFVAQTLAALPKP